MMNQKLSMKTFHAKEGGKKVKVIIPQRITRGGGGGVIRIDRPIGKTKELGKTKKGPATMQKKKKEYSEKKIRQGFTSIREEKT